MCGVVAVVADPGADPGELGARVARGLDAIKHRGPDGRGTAIDKDHGVGLGHVRLATRALANGAQPIRDTADRLWVSCSGELYDYDATRRALEANGHRFTSDSDCELILHLYAEYGARGCAERLRGEFAFVLWDQKARTIVAARDGFGVRPLLYSRPDPSTILFASEAKALFAMGVDAAWDEGSLAVALSFQYPPIGATLYRSVRELEPGEVMVVRVGAPGDSLESSSHRIPSRSRTAPESYGDAADAVRATLAEAVKERLAAEVPIAALLSGGLDSTFVAALAAQHLPGLPAYTVSFRDERAFDEVELAAETARALGLDHRVVELRTPDLLDALQTAVAHAEGFCVNHHAAAKYLLMRRLRADGVRVALTGEGADELFFGYPHLSRDHSSMGSSGHATASDGLMLPTSSGADLAATYAPIEGALGFVPTWVRAKAELGQRVQALMRPEAARSVRDLQPAERFAATLEGARRHLAKDADRATVAAETWSRTALSGYILRTLSDRMELASGVEGRPAFLDQEVAALARSIPTECKLRRGEAKAVLRQAAQGVVPNVVRARPKHPFLAPALGQSQILGQLDRRAFQGAGPFCPDAIAKVVAKLDGAAPEERLPWQPAILIALSYAWLEDAWIR